MLGAVIVPSLQANYLSQRQTLTSSPLPCMPARPTQNEVTGPGTDEQVESIHASPHGRVLICRQYSYRCGGDIWWCVAACPPDLVEHYRYQCDMTTFVRFAVRLAGRCARLARHVSPVWTARRQSFLCRFLPTKLETALVSPVSAQRRGRGREHSALRRWPDGRGIANYQTTIGDKKKLLQSSTGYAYRYSS
ncbi:hypothetical protein LZ31DRAFT_391306 [Colletotrichum somersetense]|nr:hypothetical protein LZ31DRAFT_391306 [Colletotrichum somersetense]